MHVDRIVRRLIAAALAASAVLAPVTAAHAAETPAPPSHLAAYHLEWLDYLAPSDVPAKPAAVCLIDSGVRVTPDTPADSPAGPIVARLAVDGGAGTPEGQTFEHLHGTRMAMAMAAPQNGWGTIGTWNRARIVAVRGTTAGESSFRAEDYAVAINRCIKYQENTGTRIAAINLSLGCSGCTLTPDQEAVLEDRLARAHGFAMSVIAAAGNDGGAVQVPASLPGAFAVAAGDSSGALCPYGSFGAQVAVVGPACPVEAADVLTGQPVTTTGGGSSVATAVTSTLLAALRSLRPDASWEQAESWVRSSARTVDGRRVLDGRAAALAAGLGPVVARADARRAAAVQADQPTSKPAVIEDGVPWGGGRVIAESRRRLPVPKVALARRRRHRISVVVLNRPARARIRMTLERLAADGLRTRASKRVEGGTSRIRASTRWRPGRIRLRFVPARGGRDKRRLSREEVLYRHGKRYR